VFCSVAANIMSRVEILKHLEKIFYVVLAAVVMIAFTRLFDVPDYKINANIKAPLVKTSLELVDQVTGESYPLPDPGGPNPIEVHLKNTGKKPIANLEVILEFEAVGDFNLLDEKYAVKPGKGFGKINLSAPKNVERRVRLELFNPGDEFMYFATGTRPVKIIAYSKFPGLSFYQHYSPVGKYDKIIRLSVIIFLVISTFFGLLSVCIVQKRIIEQCGIWNISDRGFINVYWYDRTKRERLFFYAGFCLVLLSGISLAKVISNT
jgi:hypothetical protein